MRDIEFRPRCSVLGTDYCPLDVKIIRDGGYVSDSEVIGNIENSELLEVNK